MTQLVRLTVSLVLLATSLPLNAQWKRVARGVEYREFSPNPPFIYRVAKVDLTEESLKVVGSRPTDRGMTVSDFADRHDALVAINGDYFDEKLIPVGATAGACGVWKERVAAPPRRQPIVAFGNGRADIIETSTPREQPPAWVEHAVSGWPMLVRNCRALSSKELPGSDSFTRAPHSRTAVGFSADKKTLYLVVAEGKKDKSAGVTLAELGAFMQQKLGVCEALNLDGGGSTAMAVDEKLVSNPVYGHERPVANHLAVIEASSYEGCTTTGSEGTTKKVASADFWRDLDEIFGIGGHVVENLYQQMFVGSKAVVAGSVELDAGMAMMSTVTFKRRTSGVAVVGSVAVTNGEVQRVSDILASGGMSVTSSRPFGPTTPEVRSVLFSGKGSATDLAHTVRKAFDAAGSEPAAVVGDLPFQARDHEKIFGVRGRRVMNSYIIPLRTRGPGDTRLAGWVAIQRNAVGGRIALEEKDVTAFAKRLERAGLKITDRVAIGVDGRRATLVHFYHAGDPLNASRAIAYAVGRK